MLAATGTVPAPAVEGLVLLGELGLDGSVRGISYNINSDVFRCLSHRADKTAIDGF